MATTGTRLTAVESTTSPAPKPRKRPSLWVLIPLGFVAQVAIIGVFYNVRRGAVAERIANRAVQGAPRPVSFLFGKPDWIVMQELGLAVMLITLVAIIAVFWQRYPRHPLLLMAIAATALVVWDPVMNWAPFAVYNPQLTHWPETWPWVSLAPTVEPFIIMGYATFYVLPALPAIWILRRMQARRPLDSFLWRHPLISLIPLIYVIGFVYDAFLEIFCVKSGLYIYSQVIPFGSLFAGKPYQFPLLWESSLVTLVMIPAGMLLYRDDTGKTKAEKLAQRVRAFRGRPATGTFAVMFALLSVAYLAYGGAFAAIRLTHSATSVACPYPYPEAKVYDPQGFYEKAGQPGPFFPGNWSGGRPNVSPPANGGRCTPKS